MTRRNQPDLPSRETKQFRFELADSRRLTIQRAEGGEVEVLRVEGHASVFETEYKVWGGPPYGWIETIDRAAFDETLANDPDVVFLLNHSGMTMARTKSGTLVLTKDDTGLRPQADLDLRNPDVQALESGLERGDIDEMSFAFRVTKQMWEEHPDYEGDEFSLRRIMGVNLNRGDVSAVNFGASPETDIDIMRALQDLDQRELAEAQAVINRRLANGKEKPGGTPGEVTRSGMLPEDLALLAIPDNPLLKGY